MTIVGPRRVTRIGKSSTTISGIGKLPAALMGATARSAHAGAVRAKREIQGIQERQGDGAWPPLSKVTVEAKGHSKIMLDSGQLAGGVEIRALGPMTYAVGWFDDTRHDAAPWLTVADLAVIHDGGTADGNTPSRHWLSQFVYREDLQDDIFNAMRNSFFVSASTMKSLGGIPA